MKGMLKKGFRRDLLILLASLVDELEYNSIRYRVWRSFTGEDYRPQSFAKNISKILQIGDIEKVEKNGEVVYRITSKGWQSLKETIPILRLAEKSWDEKWRIVIFDISEKFRKQRSALRSKLLSLGFGMWQESVYICPHKIEDEINEYFLANGLGSTCFCLVAKRSDLGNDKELSNKIWKLDELSEKYEEVIADCKKILGKEEIKNEAAKGFRELWFKYRDLVLEDPHLPNELLPSNWRGISARKICQKYLLMKVRSATDK